MSNGMILPSLKAQRLRRGPKVWQKVFDEACRAKTYSKSGFGYSQIKEIAENNGLKISREGIRVKLDRYRKRGYVKKISRGRFHIAPEGYYFFGLIDMANPEKYLEEPI